MKKYIEPALEMHKLTLPVICNDLSEKEDTLSVTDNEGLDGGEIELGL